MKQLSDYSVAELRRAIDLKEQMDLLHRQLESILGITSPTAAQQPQAAAPPKRKVSPAHRRKLIRILARARRIRWAKARAAAAEQAQAAAPRKRKVSPAHRRKLIRILARARRIRWAKARAKASAA